MNRKKLMMILATTIVMVMLLVPMMASQIASAATYDADNMVVDGVLSTDKYVLYPYEDEDLIFGFSKYGELINGEAKQGLEYDGMDVFANPNVLERDWSQGWFIDIHYVDLANVYQNAWAYALYTDLSGTVGIGGDWKEGVTNGPLGTPYGGRKTNVWVNTDDIKVLYDGPRRFVALTRTVIYDDPAKTVDDELVSVTITFVFNKVKKIVILYKDIKRLDEGKFGRTFQVEFSNRGEWDIGTSSAPPAYGHFYDNLATEYDGEYHEFYNTTDPLGYDLAQMMDAARNYVGFAAFWPPLFGKLIDGTTHITRSTILSSLCTKDLVDDWMDVDEEGPVMMTFADLGYPSSDPYPIGLGMVSDEPMVFINDILVTGGGVDYTWDGVNDQITFTVEPMSTDDIRVVYKHQTPSGGGYDDMSLHIVDEPDTPYVIGEWVFDLKNEDHKRMFRCVTVYGLTDLHTADDDDRTGGSNIIDNEVDYLLDETFRPYDLKQAVHKDTRRWLYKRTLTSTTTSITLAEAPMDARLPDWNEYCTFAERVLVNGVLQVPQRADGAPYDYTLTVSPTTGKGTITFRTAKAAGTHVKILYSTLPTWTDNTALILGRETWSDTVQPGAEVLVFSDISGSASLPTNPLGVDHEFGFDIGSIYVGLEVDDNFTNTDDEIDLDLQNEEFKVIYDPNTTPDYMSYATTDDLIIEEEYSNVNYTMWVGPPTTYGFWLTMENNFEATYVDNIDVEFELLFDTWYNTTTDELNVTLTVTANIAYNEHQEGQYEWMVVGKDAATIDSAGAAYITQAFDSKKQIHVRMTGMDIRDQLYGVNAPYVMAGASTGERNDYYYDYAAVDLRSALRDDWCTSNPVASSNMLFTGGPRANLGTEYFNEFAMAMFAGSEWVVSNIGQADKILAISCWDRHSYGSGHAVISVYKDINGTIGFTIWGMDGQDTYFATKWFWDSGIYYLQQENDGVTDIILKITYPPFDPIHPTFSIVERLGTISHKPQHDCPVEEIPV